MLQRQKKKKDEKVGFAFDIDQRLLSNNHKFFLYHKELECLNYDDDDEDSVGDDVSVDANPLDGEIYLKKAEAVIPTVCQEVDEVEDVTNDRKGLAHPAVLTEKT